jgi:hypothetical protein
MKTKILIAIGAALVIAAFLRASAQSPTPAPALTVTSQPTPAPVPPSKVFKFNAAAGQALLSQMYAGIIALDGTDGVNLPPVSQVAGFSGMVNADGSVQMTVSYSAPITTGS